MMEVGSVGNEPFGKGEPISDSSQVTPSWLAGVLKNSRAFQHVEVSSVNSTVKSTLLSQLAFLTVDYAKGTEPNVPTKLLLKINNPNWDKDRPDSANEYKEMGKKEVLFNNVIASKINPSALVPCYDAVYNVETNRFHILMADLTETHFQTEWPLPPLKRHCELVIDAIADVHAACWDDQELFEAIDPQFTQRDHSQIKQQIQTGIQAYLEFLGDRLSDERRNIYEQVSSGLPDVLTKRWTIGSGLTLIHGDAHFWNVLMPYDTDKDTVRIIDWASYRIHWAAIDLAYMMAHHWYPERRKRLEMELLNRYYDRLLGGGVSGYDWDDFWYDYRLCTAANTLIPIFQWRNKIPAAIWWSHLERSMLSYEDLGCAELLRS
jgi:hypothetical protein